MAVDPSYINKSGRQSYGLGCYWPRCAKACKRGLEICGFTVVDIMNNTAFHLWAIQTPTLEKGSSLLEHYASLIKEYHLHFREFSSYLAASAYFSKAPFLDAVISCGLDLVSRLRDDANLLYLFRGEQNGKKGRNKKYDGKADVKNPGIKHFILVKEEKDFKIYSAKVWSVSFKKEINLVLVVFLKDGKEVCHKLYFSTDLELDAVKLVQYYCSRFQIEFLYRNAKQHTGLNDVQARSKTKLDFHFNAALTAVNLAKVRWMTMHANANIPFSTDDCKRMEYNQLMLQTFFRMFDINLNLPKNKQKVKELLKFGVKAEC